MVQVPLTLKGPFAQLLEQNPGFLYKVDQFLGLPCIRNRFIVLQFSKYDFWTPGMILGGKTFFPKIFLHFPL